MRKAGIAFTFMVALVLAVPPPTLYADECYVNTNRYLGYFPDCACQACAGWAMTNCTECTDGNGQWCQTIHASQRCGPWNNNW